ncbi:hypothetical protein [Chitinimonas arctica]|nr:hypothetical protein [Chitinimonas arctica]
MSKGQKALEIDVEAGNSEGNELLHEYFSELQNNGVKKSASKEWIFR